MHIPLEFPLLRRPLLRHGNGKAITSQLDWERREKREGRTRSEEDGRNDCSTAASKLALVKDAFEANERPQRHDMLNTTTCAFRL